MQSTADYAQVSAKTVRRWLASGLLPFHRLGRNIRIAEADLLAFLASGGKAEYKCLPLSTAIAFLLASLLLHIGHRAA